LVPRLKYASVAIEIFYRWHFPFLREYKNS
jgi:hypothetical protein